MNKLLDIIMPVGGGTVGGIVGAVESHGMIEHAMSQSVMASFVDSIIYLITIIPTMIIGAIIGWAVKKTCDYLFDKYKHRKCGKKKNRIRIKKLF